LNIDFADAEKIAQTHRGELSGIGVVDVVGIIPVHVGGAMVVSDRLRAFSATHDLWVVEVPRAFRRLATERRRQWFRAAATRRQ
jgi:hypothetical protein